MMQTPLAEYKKNIVSINAFGGLNHTDFTQPGEWYDMVNVADKYAPLLAPRWRRKTEWTLPFAADEVLLKNGIWYFTQTGNGIYCYAPDGNNPFADDPTTVPVRIFEGIRPYRLMEMGNGVLAVATDGSGTAVSIRNGNVKEVGAGTGVKAELLDWTTEADGTHTKVTDYFLFNLDAQRWHTNGGYYQNDTTRLPSGYAFDETARNLLNIGFTLVEETDDGSYGFLKTRNNKYDPDTYSSSSSGYFYDNDYKLYYFNKELHTETGAGITEIANPCVAILIRFGTQDNISEIEEKLFQFQAGDHIKLNVANRSGFYRKPGENTISNRLLRVKAVQTVDGNHDMSNEDWEYCIIIDYNASFIQELKQKDLVVNSKSYTYKGHYTFDYHYSNPANQGIFPTYITIESAFPEVEHCLEHNNRVWAVNNENNEIKASAQGNFEAWDDYRGLVSDSYAVSVGTNEKFTASCAIDDYLFFFKEHSYTMVYGTRPSNFCTNTVKEFIGISADGACSLQVIGKSAFYMGIDGRFYRFNGQSSVFISSALGEDRYTPLSSAHTAEKYYVHASRTGAQNNVLLVYNTTTGMWYREDAEDLTRLCNINGQACAISAFSAAVDGEDTVCSDISILEPWEPEPQKNSRVAWECESGLLGLESDFYQYISNLKITFESEVGARLEVYAKYDNEADYQLLATFVSERKGTRSEKIHIRRCAFMRLKLKGTGFSKIFRISYVTGQGGEK